LTVLPMASTGWYGWSSVCSAMATVRRKSGVWIIDEEEDGESVVLSGM
jgi:hypothetical protein